MTVVWLVIIKHKNVVAFQSMHVYISIGFCFAGQRADAQSGNNAFDNMCVEVAEDRSDVFFDTLTKFIRFKNIRAIHTVERREKGVWIGVCARVCLFVCVCV